MCCYILYWSNCFTIVRDRKIISVFSVITASYQCNRASVRLRLKMFWCIWCITFGAFGKFKNNCVNKIKLNNLKEWAFGLIGIIKIALEVFLKTYISLGLSTV